MIVQILTPAGWVPAEQLELLFPDEHDENAEQAADDYKVNYF
jgi:hypothetical protein